MAGIFKRIFWEVLIQATSNVLGIKESWVAKSSIKMLFSVKILNKLSKWGSLFRFSHSHELWISSKGSFMKKKEYISKCHRYFIARMCGVLLQTKCFYMSGSVITQITTPQSLTLAESPVSECAFIARVSQTFQRDSMHLHSWGATEAMWFHFFLWWRRVKHICAILNI